MKKMSVEVEDDYCGLLTIISGRLTGECELAIETITIEPGETQSIRLRHGIENDEWIEVEENESLG